MGTDWAVRAARAYGAGPSTSPQNCCDLGCRLARPQRDIGPGVPERGDSLRGRGIVAADVLPSAIVRVSSPAVKLDAYGLLGVEVVQVGGLDTPHDLRLSDGFGQPMRSLHSMHVAVLQQGVHAFADICKGSGQVRSPAHLLAHGHRGRSE